jgi:hypothetical protein
MNSRAVNGLLGLVLGAVMALMGLGAASDPELSSWEAGAFGVALGGFGIWVAVSSWFEDVVVTADHVLVRSFMGWRRVPRRVSMHLGPGMWPLRA